MDAFAVAISLGLTMKRTTLKKALTVGAYFGTFQAGMPLIGYVLGIQFADTIVAFDHWIAFVLLGFIGGKMINESFKQEERGPNREVSLKFAPMLPLALATSVDALAVGVSFAFLKVNVIPAVLWIGMITFILSVAGVKIGNVFGTRFKGKAELAGGIILVLMGMKILLEHMGIVNI